MLDAYSVNSLKILKWLDPDDKWGEKQTRTEVEATGYVEYKTALVTNIKGEEVTFRAKVWIEKDRLDIAMGRELRHEDRIKIEDESYDHAIIRIDKMKDFGNTHYEIYIT